MTGDAQAPVSESSLSLGKAPQQKTKKRHGQIVSVCLRHLFLYVSDLCGHSKVIAQYLYTPR